MPTYENAHAAVEPMDQDLPRVTEIIRDAGLINTTWMNEYGRDRGTAVHQACALFDQDDLDARSVDFAILGYLEAWKDFRRKTETTILAIEEPVRSALWRYRGTVDRVLTIFGRRGILDIKTGHLPDWIRLQTAAYLQAAQEAGWAVTCRWGVQLKTSGAFKLREYKLPSDLTEFLNCMERAKDENIRTAGAAREAGAAFAGDVGSGPGQDPRGC